MSKNPDFPVDEVTQVECFEKLIEEANGLAVRLGIDEVSEPWGESGLYETEKSIGSNRR
jgi:hypothetical protein